MTTVLVHHRVADYDVWKREYDLIVAGPLGASVRGYRIWRGVEDPNLVVVAETYESRAAADEAAAQPDLPAAFARAGVVMSSMKIDFVEEVEAGSGHG
jgi:hypothetical protein